MSKSFSVIIPVIAEADIISRSIDHVYRTGSGFDVEIIVVDGDVHGSTINAITNPRPILMTSAKGRGIQMNKGAASARGEILLFLHADTELPENAFESIVTVLKGDQCVAGVFDLGINSGRWIYRVIEKAVAVRNRLTRAPYGDQAIFIKRDHFERMNGFREIPLMEDVDLMRRLKKAGHKIAIIPNKVRTSPRRWESEGIIFCTLRNWALMSLYSLGVEPEKLWKFYYRGHDG